MTNSHNEMIETLLRPTEFWEPALVATEPGTVPKVPGIYAWWFDEGTLPTVPTEGCLLQDGRNLLYVGIAPNGATRTSGLRTLRDRLKDHCCGTIGRSTLRRTLTALLVAEQGWKVSRNTMGRQVMSDEHEAGLNRWMAAHARVVWLPHLTPWLIEDDLVHAGEPRLPLNIAGSPDPYRQELSMRRRQLGRT